MIYQFGLQTTIDKIKGFYLVFKNIISWHLFIIIQSSRKKYLHPHSYSNYNKLSIKFHFKLSKFISLYPYHVLPNVRLIKLPYQFSIPTPFRNTFQLLKISMSQGINHVSKVRVWVVKFHCHLLIIYPFHASSYLAQPCSCLINWLQD